MKKDKSDAVAENFMKTNPVELVLRDMSAHLKGYLDALKAAAPKEGRRY